MDADGDLKTITTNICMHIDALDVIMGATMITNGK